MLWADRLSKTFGLNRVLNDVSVNLHAGDHIGVVGANGVGKSTLLRILAGELPADEGSVRLGAGARLGYFAQSAPLAAALVGDLIDAAFAPLRTMETRLHALEAMMSRTTGEALDTALAEYGELAEGFERAGGYTLDAQIEAVFGGLGIAGLERDRAVNTLSGGEAARVRLALLLLTAPDVLLLDEPTNHLDRDALAWLETALAAYRGALMVVSHDRAFLNRTVNAILEIDEHTRSAKRYTGDYDTYAEAKRRERAVWEATWERQQEELSALRHELAVGSRTNSNYRAHTDNDKFVRNGKRATHDATVSKRVRVSVERLARLEAEAVPQPPEPLRFRPNFSPERFGGRHILTADRVTQRYGERVILDGISLALPPDGRLLIVGENGAGKTTLLRLLAGFETPQTGRVTLHPQAQVGYLAQGRPNFAPDMTLFEAFGAGLSRQSWHGHEWQDDEQALKALLIKSGLFRYEMFETPARNLSRGQERKLELARIIASGANLLILDEPTNDLAFDVIEALEAALRDFPGAILTASHDRRFIETFAGDVMTMREGKLTHGVELAQDV